MRHSRKERKLAVRKVDIRPGVSVLSVLRHLNYRPWYALSEFVDNAVQSFTEHQEELRKVHGDGVKLHVNIDIDPTSPPRISIRDNAAGIFDAEYGRAFCPAAIPPDRMGLAEFGMGMKSAACWFAPRWMVRTSALGEPVARTIHFDIANIVTDDIEELAIQETREARETHYTEIVLEDVFRVPVGRTVGKLKEHLAGIYRAFIRNGILELRFNSDPLQYREPQVLKAAYFKSDSTPSIEWHKLIDFDFGNGPSVHGFAALRDPGSTTRAGFSLFRRGRVIQGSGDECYRPPYIFGSSNSYRYQRLFGELHLKGFEVSHTKDGFRWDDKEQPFLELLREHLDAEELPLLKQAEGYRTRKPPAQLKKSARRAVNNTAQAMETQLPKVLPAVADAEPVDTPTEEAPPTSTLAGRCFDIQFRDRKWAIKVELIDDPSESQWLDVTNVAQSLEQPRRLSIRVSMHHPLMVRFAQTDSENMEALLRVAAAIAVAEVLARDAGVRKAGTVRRNVNDILRYALAQP